MNLIQFLDRVFDKVIELKIQPERDKNVTHIILRNDEAFLIGHLHLLQQYANHKGTKFWRVPNKTFRSHWLQVVPVIKKHDPNFFDEFKDDEQARAELQEMLGSKKS